MESFNAQKLFNPKGKSPNICTEFYTGWLTHWGEGMANTSSAQACEIVCVFVREREREREKEREREMEEA